MAQLTADRQGVSPPPRHSAPAPAGRPVSALRRRLGDNANAYAFLAAGLLCFGFFSWYPMVRGVLLSFEKTNGTDTWWVGLQNYRQVFTDPLFPVALRNTLYFTLLALVLGYLVPFAVAVLINEMRHLRTLFRVLVYVPVIMPPTVSVLLWKYFYDPDSGLFNSVLGALHLPQSQWFQSDRVAMISIVLMSTWANMGGAVIMYLAGLGSIPGELYEAAELDGASVWKRLRYVTIPQMRFIMLVLLLLQIVATMQVFIEPFLLTGFTDNATITIFVLIYRYAFTVNNDFGLAAALSTILFVVLGLFSAAYLRLTRKAD